MSTYKVISADSHVIEPPNVWKDYIEPAYKSRAPHVVREGEFDVWKCENTVLGPVAAYAGAGKPSDKLKSHGTYEKDTPKGSYDPSARLAEMAVDAVEAEVLYPSVALRMFGIPDGDFQAACFRAYNSWIADFCKPYPNVFKGVGILTIDDVEAAAGEVRRCRKLGLSGVSISVNPEGGRYYSDPTFDPLWSAAEECDMPISLHILTERKHKQRMGEDFLSGQVTESVMIQDALARMIFSGVFLRHPKLKIVSAENDIGWAGYFLERADYLHDRRQVFHKMGIPRDMLPSHFFHRHVFLTFMRDRSGVMLRSIIGVENLMWASDYPHLDSTWPNSMKMIERIFAGVPEGERRKIVCENAANLYHYP
jgi:predicted TIM-barrel fold metal-dependent hydrolase